MASDARRTNATRLAPAAVRDGVVVFALVVAGFFTYALTAKETYKATAIVHIEAGNDGEATSAQAPQAAARLRAVLLEPSLLESLSRREAVGPSKTLAETIVVETSDARRFEITARASHANSARRVANELAEKATESARSILGSPPDPAPPPSRSAMALAEFLSAHPALLAAASAAPPTVEPETAASRLGEEKRRIEHALRSAPPPSDNPYAEPNAGGKRESRERRLREIDTELARRGSATLPAGSARSEDASAAANPDRQELDRLLRATLDARAPSPRSVDPSVRASFIAAPLPDSPERPNRLLVVVVGVMVGLVWGFGAFIGRSYFGARRAARPRARVAMTRSGKGATKELPAQAGNGEGVLGRRLAEVLWPSRQPVRPARILAEAVSSRWRPDPDLVPAALSDLCDEVLPFVVENCFVIGVTAVPEVASRKGSLATELALAFTEPGGLRVLLLEASFHAPEIHRALRIEVRDASGFSQQLQSRAHADEDSEWRVLDCGRSLHVIAEGATRSPGVLLSSQFEEAIRSLRTYYDLIVLNGPLTSAELDCRALDAVLDGVVVACPSGGSPFLEPALGIFEAKRFSRVVSV